MASRRRGSSLTRPAPDIQDEVVIVVLGASGDLAKKKTVSHQCILPWISGSFKYGIFY